MVQFFICKDNPFTALVTFLLRKTTRLLGSQFRQSVFNVALIAADWEKANELISTSSELDLVISTSNSTLGKFSISGDIQTPMVVVMVVVMRLPSFNEMHQQLPRQHLTAGDK